MGSRAVAVSVPERGGFTRSSAQSCNHVTGLARMGEDHGRNERFACERSENPRVGGSIPSLAIV
jgi:hypothetical protein